MLGDGLPWFGLFGVHVNEFFYQCRNLQVTVFYISFKTEFLCCFHRSFYPQKYKSTFPIILFFSMFFFVVKYTQHKIHHFNHFKVYIMVLTAFTCGAIITTIYLQNCFHLPKLKLYPFNTNSSSQPLVTITLIKLTTLGTSYKWNHTVYVVLCQSYCTFVKKK